MFSHPTRLIGGKRLEASFPQRAHAAVNTQKKMPSVEEDSIPRHREENKRASCYLSLTPSFSSRTFPPLTISSSPDHTWTSAHKYAHTSARPPACSQAQVCTWPDWLAHLSSSRWLAYSGSRMQCGQRTASHCTVAPGPPHTGPWSPWSAQSAKTSRPETSRSGPRSGCRRL